MRLLFRKMQAIKQVNFNSPKLRSFYRGKVRDVFDFGNTLAMVASDRISAFDVVLPNPIPFKGQVLNQTAAYFLNATKDCAPNWLIETPDPNIAVGYKCTPIPIEMVVRGYLAGHAARLYKAGERNICGVDLPEGLKENDLLPKPIITPTTKASEGHDLDISREEILSQGIVEESIYTQMESYAYKLFERGSQMASERNLILVDTKYEFGFLNGEVTLMDEIHTPDSSRYFYADTYQQYQQEGKAQRQLSKEFVRQWLIENGFQGKEGQTIPTFSEEFVSTISNRYIELYEQVTGLAFVKAEENIDPIARITQVLSNVAEKYAN